jgi:hypothetical protein
MLPDEQMLRRDGAAAPVQQGTGPHCTVPVRL